MRQGRQEVVLRPIGVLGVAPSVLLAGQEGLVLLFRTLPLRDVRGNGADGMRLLRHLVHGELDLMVDAVPRAQSQRGLELDRLPRLQNLLLACAQRVGGAAIEQLDVAPPLHVGHRATAELLVPPVRQDIAAVAALHEEDHRRVIEDELELAIPLTERCLGRPQPEQRPHGRDQLFCLHRLDQIGVGPVLEGLQPVRAAGGGRRNVQHEDRGGVGVALEPAADLEPADVRHVDVKQDQRGLVLDGEPQRVRAGCGLDDVEAGLAQSPCARVQPGGVVVDVEERDVTGSGMAASTPAPGGPRLVNPRSCSTLASVPFESTAAARACQASLFDIAQLGRGQDDHRNLARGIRALAAPAHPSPNPGIIRSRMMRSGGARRA